MLQNSDLHQKTNPLPLFVTKIINAQGLSMLFLTTLLIITD